MLKPRALRPGDRVAVIAPASPFQLDEFDRGVAELSALGFEAVFDESVFDRRGYVAGPPDVRAGAITRAWRDPSIAGLIGVRGGYGSAQVLPLLDRALARAARKPLVGYSDLTALLTFLTVGCELACFHGPMLAGTLASGADAYDRDSFLRALTRPEPVGEIGCEGVEVVATGEARGPLYGGNLTQLVASFGTPYAFHPPPGHVLFLDEVGERPYRIDRMLTQLRLGGLLDRAAAVVVGQLPNCDEPGGEPTARAVVSGLFRDFRGPVVFGLPSGHTTKPALTLPLGVEVRVIAGEAARLVIEEAAVE
jgi:muramoyltetrapeptide carboxypeptidase